MTGKFAQRNSIVPAAVCCIMAAAAVAGYAGDGVWTTDDPYGG